MIGAVNEHVPAARPAGAEAGKRAQAVGQQAKAAVAAAREAGVELPRNAQGIAASGIARGADPASVLAALTAPPAEDGAPGEEDAIASAEIPPAEETPPGPDEAGEAVSAAEVSEQGAEGAAAPAIAVDGAETALALLDGVLEGEDGTV